MKRPILILMAWLAAGLPLRAAPARTMVLQDIPVELRGVGDPMEAPAKLVLEKQLAISGDHTASAPLADDLAFFLQLRYLQLGYPKAMVDWKLAGRTLILEAEEGPKRTVGDITFTGVDAAQAEILEPYLTRETREREGRLAKSLPFVASDLQAGLGLVVRKLQADGFLQAAAAPPVFTENAATGSTDIVIALTPGPQSVFGEIAVEGDATPLSREAMKKIADLTGQPFSEVKLENVRKEVKGDLQTNGRFAAEVTASARPGTTPAGAIPAGLKIVPGAVFRVTEVRTSEKLGRGARRVADSVFRSATQQDYDPETLDLLHRRSMDTGIFSRLDVDPIALGPDTLALGITGEEAKPKTLGFFGGYETFYGPIAGIETRHVNFLDTGNSLGLRAELRGTGANGSLQWTDPAVLGSRNALGVGLAYENFTFKDYTRDTLSLRGSLTRRFNRHITAEVFSAYSLSKVESDFLTPGELGPDDYGTLTAGRRLIFDYRDNPLNPRSGWLAGAGFEGGYDQGGEDDINFGRTDLNAAFYHPFSPSWRIAVAARASAIQGPDSLDELPIDLRLFNGGGTTVRSFAEREMGPTSGKGSTPLGGLATTVLNAEVSYKIINNLEVAAFVDAGTLSRDSGSLFNMDDIRYGVGLGIRYELPIGPLRVDYGYNPDRQPGEAAGALHITFGFAF